MPSAELDEAIEPDTARRGLQPHGRGVAEPPRQADDGPRASFGQLLRRTSSSTRARSSSWWCSAC